MTQFQLIEYQDEKILLKQKGEDIQIIKWNLNNETRNDLENTTPRLKKAIETTSPVCTGTEYYDFDEEYTSNRYISLFMSLRLWTYWNNTTFHWQQRYYVEVNVVARKKNIWGWVNYDTRISFEDGSFEVSAPVELDYDHYLDESLYTWEKFTITGWSGTTTQDDDQLNAVKWLGNTYVENVEEELPEYGEHTFCKFRIKADHRGMNGVYATICHNYSVCGSNEY